MENVVRFINKYIDPFASMEQHPGRQRHSATPISAKGYVYPPTEKHGSISKKLALRIDFERMCQKNSENIVLGIFLSNLKDWYVINALARCMELRRSRVWHRAKRVFNLTTFGLMPYIPSG